MSRHQGPTLAEIEAIAFGQAHGGDKPTAYALQAAQHQVNVAKGLIAMRKAGLLAAVHVDQGLVAIELPDHTRRRITWAAAEGLVGEFVARERLSKAGRSVDKPARKGPRRELQTPAKTAKNRRKFT